MTRRVRVRIGIALALALVALVVAPGCGGGGRGCKERPLVLGGGVIADTPPPPPIVHRVVGVWQGATNALTPPPGQPSAGTPAGPVGPMRLTIGRDGATGEEGALAGTLKNYTDKGFYVDTTNPQGLSEGATLTFAAPRYNATLNFTLEPNGHFTGSLYLTEIGAAPLESPVTTTI